MATPRLHPDFLRLPLAHRALHDRAAGRPENGLSSIRAAVAAGYGIEIDLQLSADGAAMVFHDATLDRVAEGTGPVFARTSTELEKVRLRGSDDTIPTLGAVLQAIDGRVPLLIEVKDQAEGGSSAGIGPLEAATARTLADWPAADEWVAVMSFNPASVAAMARHAPGIPRGLTTFAWPEQDAPALDPQRRAALRDIADFDAVGACFVSHHQRDLARPRIADLRRQGAAILCWTIRSTDEESQARKMADNITFEGYLPIIPRGSRATT